MTSLSLFTVRNQGHLMHNLSTVIGFEFSRTIRRKSFWLSTLAIPFLIGVVIAISYFSDKSAGKTAEAASAQHFSIAVVDQSKLVKPAVLHAAHAQVLTSKQEGIADVESGAVQAFFYYPQDPAKEPIQVYGKDIGIVKNGEYGAVATQLLQTSVISSIGSPEKIALIQNSANTQLTTYQSGHTVDDSINRVLPPAAFILLFYLVIILLGNQMLSSTTEEKENRVVEMILTTVSSTSLIVGKIIAMMAVGFLQIAVIVVPTVLAYLKFRSSLAIPSIDLSKLVFDPGQLLVGAVIFAGGFLLFTGLLVAIGAAMPTAKEANRFFGVAMFSMIIPVYGVAAIISDPSLPVVKIFTYFPLTAPVTLMLRNAVGNLTPQETAIGIAIVVASGIAAVAIAIKTFRSGTLQYSRRLTLSEIFGRHP